MGLTFGSLFAGVGGFDMGFEQAGWDCKFQVEWDKNCRTILDKHWPDVEKWGDIRNVDGRFLPPVDCIIFGSPCQDLSLAGARKGLSGERSGLFHEAVRIIKEMRDATNGTYPRWTVWENVAGALSSNNGRDFGTVINEMAKAGAHLQEYAVLDAQHFGIPQRRRRVFLTSCFDPATAERCPDPILPVRKSLLGNTKKGKPKKQIASRTLTESFGDGGGIVNAIGASIYHKQTVVNQDVNSGHLITEGGILGSNIIGPLNTSDAKMISTQYVAENKCVVEPYLSFDTQFGSNANVFKDQIPTLKATQQPPSVAYDEYNNSISEIHHSLRAGTKQSTGVLESTMKVRRLTPIECERLMGWPDDHTKHTVDGTIQADVHRYRQCGNGVATPVARWVAEQIAKVEHGKR
jgi:DNA (cytosine-5)-methyltransferase 1